MMKKFVLVSLLLAFIFPAASSGQGSTFQFTNAGSTIAVDNALDYCGQIWGQYLNSDITIKVNTYYAALGAGTTLAITIPNGIRDWGTAPLDSVNYPTCLANSIDGTELNPGEADMDIIINSSVNWYFGTDGDGGASEYDFVTVLLHEIGHGLGFLSGSKLESSEGSIGYVDSTFISPFVTSFPFPELGGKFTIFSHYMETGAGDALNDTSLFPNPSLTLGTALTSNDIYFDAPISRAANGGNPVRVYAPAAWAPGSSMEHVNEATFPSGNVNALMTPFVSSGETHHTPGIITLSILEDIGWNVNYTVSNDIAQNIFGIGIFPNPAAEKLFVQLDSKLVDGELKLLDISGRFVAAQSASQGVNSIDLEDFQPGIYVLQVYEGSALKCSRKVVKK